MHYRALKLPTGAITVNWSPDGRRLAAAAGRGSSGGSGEYSTVGVWKMDDTAKPVIEIQTVGIGASVIPSPDGQRLALERREDVRLWKWDGTPDGKHLASEFAASDWRSENPIDHDEHAVQLWSVDGAPGPLLEGHQGVIRWVAWSPDGRHSATAGSDSSDGTVRFCEPDGTPVNNLVEPRIGVSYEG